MDKTSEVWNRFSEASDRLSEGSDRLRGHTQVPRGLKRGQRVFTLQAGLGVLNNRQALRNLGQALRGPTRSLLSQR